jgi:hypothetical protein
MSDDMDPNEKALLEERAELKTRSLIDDLKASGLAREDALTAVLTVTLEDMDDVRGRGEADRFLAGLLGKSLALSWSNARTDEEREAADDHAGRVMTALVGAALPSGRPAGGVVNRIQHIVFAIVRMDGGAAAIVAWAERMRDTAARLFAAERARRH